MAGQPRSPLIPCFYFSGPPDHQDPKHLAYWFSEHYHQWFLSLCSLTHGQHLLKHLQAVLSSLKSKHIAVVVRSLWSTPSLAEQQYVKYECALFCVLFLNSYPNSPFLSLLYFFRFILIEWYFCVWCNAMKTYVYIYIYANKIAVAYTVDHGF